MRELGPNEYAIQIWSKDHPNGHIETEVERIRIAFEKSGLGKMLETEGPTPHIPDFFSILYESMYGWIVYVAEANPTELKKLAMELEVVNGQRVLDIDIYLDYFNSVHRKDLE